MSGTALEHQLVREYLSELDTALRALPAAQAAELREQITAHLDEALPAAASDADVTATLGRLGTPASLAAEAAPEAAAAAQAPEAAPDAAPPSVPAVVGARLRRVRPLTWLAAALALALIAVGGWSAHKFLTTAPLQYSQSGQWWYRQDTAREHIVSVEETTQNTAPIRSGQRQGYVISIYNPNLVTQTIVGDASGPHLGWDNPGGPDEQIAVSMANTDLGNGGYAGQRTTRHLRFGLPVSIPPLQTRLVRVTWISTLCLQKGSGNGINEIYLRVRSGWFTRTEVIPQQAWDLSGPSHPACR